MHIRFNPSLLRPCLAPALCLALVLALAAPAMAWQNATLMNEPDPDDLTEYIVQAGPYTDEDQARSVLEELMARGYEPYMFAAPDPDRGMLFVLRLATLQGLQKSLEAADDFAARENVETSVSLPGQAAPVADFIFFVQALSFKHPRNAASAVIDAREKGWNATVVELLDSRDQTWFVLSVGAYPRLSQAREAAAKYEKEEGRKVFVNMMDKALFQSLNR